MNAYEETQAILHKYKIKADKSLGQNFLIDDNVIDNIIEASNIEKDDMVIEIGPGLGVLTSRLLQECKNVTVIELDKKMVKILQERFEKNIENNKFGIEPEFRLDIVNEDILKVNLASLIKKRKETSNIKQVKIVANLPYYISTPIIMKLLQERLDIDEIIVMVQKEVAERLIAKSGTRLAGAITYEVEYYSEASKVITVPKESFVPNPKVESEVIKLKVRDKPKIEVQNEKLLFSLIQKSFMQRRKTLANALLNYGFVKEKGELNGIFESLNVDSSIRGENLTLEQFGKIADYLKE